MDQVAEVVADIEAEKARGLVSGAQVFRSMLNQPALVSLNSANATSVSSQNGYSTLTLNMPRPLLEVSTLQMLNAVIPLPTTNIPDTCCAFWYYRLSAYRGLAPNTDNLYFNRLLPSYYKPENIASSSNYGWNNTFNTYADVATQLALSGTRDLALDNQTGIVGVLTDPVQYTFYKIPFIPNDVAITYNSTYNKFQLTGSNVLTPFATAAWDSGTTYSLGDVIYFYDANTNPTTATYQSVAASNVNQAPVNTAVVPPALNTAWWKQIYTDIVQNWNNTTFYRKGSLVKGIQSPYLGVYQAQWDTHASGGPLTVTYDRTWNASDLYWVNDVVTRGGVEFICIQPNSAIAPDGVGAVGYWVSFYWSSSITYAQGGHIFYLTTNLIYNSLIPNNTANPLDTGAWERLGVTDWAAWTPTTQNPNYRYLATGFNDPNVVLNQGTGQRQWSPYALYENGEYVSYGGFDYQATIQNRDFPPFQPANPTNAWSATKQYSIGSTVTYIPQNYGSQYIFLCIKANTGQYPSLGSQFWSKQVWATTTSQWDAAVYYSFGAVVKFGGKYYQCVIAGRGFNPQLNPTYWRERAWITGAAPIVGLNSISQALDMVENYTTGGFTYIDAPFPEGIPGQPFNPSPRRLLNSILGFTWNGQIPNPAILQTLVVFDPDVYGTRALIGNTGVTLYNRLRPIPPYVVEVGFTGEEGYEARPSTTTATYTAEGYANLVYTSVVQLYSTIVCGSTVNTQRNTNLLATVNMNAGNLGVAYYQNYIDDALKLYQNDIYTISIELRDEMDEPYYLTNNAICSFVMKLTYKE